ncbi:hypothetical protein DPMN_005806 [Dreissena polymorpha]|uniref:Uncharacterized protein n=1 Tax=Dreissena polymorpha TaxID=45954 RepID=A0A9D4RUV7_DREPO|nr:hypothetical protein DPMN_005806 [Dreissena polymorpha]
MLKLAQTDQQTNRQGKNNMSPTTIVGDIKSCVQLFNNKADMFNAKQAEYKQPLCMESNHKTSDELGVLRNLAAVNVRQRHLMWSSQHENSFY